MKSAFLRYPKRPASFDRVHKLRKAGFAKHSITENPGDKDGRKSPEDDQRQ
jgi:hypothetical protein